MDSNNNTINNKKYLDVNDFYNESLIDKYSLVINNIFDIIINTLSKSVLSKSKLNNTYELINNNTSITYKYQKIKNLSDKNILINRLIQSNKYYDIELIKNDIECLNIASIRSISGDGNCFYRSIVYLLLEIMLTNDDKIFYKLFLIELFYIFELNKLNSFDNDIKKYIKQLSFVFDDLNLLTKSFNMFFSINKYRKTLSDCETLYSLMYLIYIKKFESNDIIGSISMINKSFNILSTLDIYLIGFCKSKICTYLKSREDYYYSQQFDVKVSNLMPIEYETSNGNGLYTEFYTSFLLKMNKDAEKIVIYLTPYVFNVNLNIYIIEPAKVIPEYIYVCCELRNKSKIMSFKDINLLYCNNHYEIIYLKSDLLNNLIDDDNNNNNTYQNIDINLLDNINLNLKDSNTNNYNYNNEIENNKIEKLLSFNYANLLNNIRSQKYEDNDFIDIFN